MVIKLISEGKANFRGCKGPFTIGDDLSVIADMKKINLSSLKNSLQGKLDALAKCTLLETLNLSECNGIDEYGRQISEGLTGT